MSMKRVLAAFMGVTLMVGNGPVSVMAADVAAESSAETAIVNLRTVIQYEYKGKKYNFMDTYDDYDPSVQADDDDDEGIE